MSLYISVLVYNVVRALGFLQVILHITVLSSSLLPALLWRFSFFEYLIPFGHPCVQSLPEMGWWGGYVNLIILQKQAIT